MKLALFIAAVVVGLMALALYDQHQARAARDPLQCRLPRSEGDVAVVTFTVRAGEIFAECHHASARPSKLKKGG